MQLHLINTGTKFPYPYYLAVKSIKKTQKADIIMWLFDEPKGKYWNLIKPLVEIREAKAPSFNAFQGKDEVFKLSHLVDWCRWKVLYEHGGMYMDMDTLALKDMSDLLEGFEVVAPLRVKDWSSAKFPLNNAFVAAKKNSPITGSILRFVDGKLAEKDMTWGDTGPLIFNTIIREHLDKVNVLPQNYCEPYRGGELLYDNIDIFPETRMIHVCGASNRNWPLVNEEWIEKSNVLYAKLCRHILKDELHPFKVFDSWIASKGPHYKPIFEYLESHPCRKIVEIGTYNGDNAIQMIKAAASLVPEEEITYQGYDLFESMDDVLRTKELSHEDSPTLDSVQEKLSKTKAKIILIKGNTHETLSGSLPEQPDLIFIDGGHSVETIANDWGAVKKVLGPSTVVFFDDYFPNRTDLGCKSLIDSLKGAKALPKIDRYPKPNGYLESQLAVYEGPWRDAQVSEASFWRAPANMSYGQVKQQGYVDMMGLNEYGRFARFDLKGKSILDLGGGPCSLLLRCHNYGPSTVLDPCQFEPWVYERYKAAKINVVKESAEDWTPDKIYDEAWCYNVLQHVKDPQKVVDTLKKAAKKVRVFEWIDTPTDRGHPWSYKKEDLDELFEGQGTGRNVTKDDFLFYFLGTSEARVYYGVFDYPKEKSVTVLKHPDHYRFHLLGLAHLPVTESYSGCAFSQKTLKMAKMLLSLGHEVFLYGPEGSDAPCTEFIETNTLADIANEWGDGNTNFDIGYDPSTGYRHDFNSPPTKTRIKYYNSIINGVNARKQQDDFLLLSMGTYQRPIDEAVKLFRTIEYGIGYRGSYSRFRGFESTYIQNFTYGSEHPRESINGNYFDRKIANYFDPKDFTFYANREDFFLYVGRLILRKGVWTAVKTTEHIGARLLLAGQTDKEIDIKKLPSHCEYVGFLGPKERDELMGRAKAGFVPTIYLEPFGGVFAELNLTGCPVLTTNFGVFPEVIENGVNGYRADTLDDFVWAAKQVDKLDRKIVRKSAEKYLMENVRWEYAKWFDDIAQLHESAKDPNIKGWHHIRDHAPEWRKYAKS